MRNVYQDINSRYVLSVFGVPIPILQKLDIKPGLTLDNLKIFSIAINKKSDVTKWFVIYKSDLDNIKVTLDITRSVNDYDNINLLELEKLKLNIQHMNDSKLLSAQALTENIRQKTVSLDMARYDYEYQQSGWGQASKWIGGIVGLIGNVVGLGGVGKNMYRNRGQPGNMNSAFGVPNLLGGAITSFTGLGNILHDNTMSGMNIAEQELSTHKSIYLSKMEHDLNWKYQETTALKNLQSMQNTFVAGNLSDIDVVNALRDQYGLSPVHIIKHYPTGKLLDYVALYHSRYGVDIFKDGYIFEKPKDDAADIIVQFSAVSRVDGISDLIERAVVKEMFENGIYIKEKQY